MKINSINFIFLSFIFLFIYINPTLWDCIQNSDRIKERCAIECVKKYPCIANCELHYILTDCMERCCSSCAEGIKKDLEQCDKIRSDYQNECIKNFCLDPWCACPSCGMNF